MSDHPQYTREQFLSQSRRSWDDGYTQGYWDGNSDGKSDGYGRGFSVGHDYGLSDMARSSIYVMGVLSLTIMLLIALNIYQYFGR